MLAQVLFCDSVSIVFAQGLSIPNAIVAKSSVVNNVGSQNNTIMSDFVGLSVLMSLVALVVAIMAIIKVSKDISSIGERLGDNTNNKEYDGEFKKLQEAINKLSSEIEEIKKKIPKNPAPTLTETKKPQERVDGKIKKASPQPQSQKKAVSRPDSDAEYLYLKVGVGGILKNLQTPDRANYRAWRCNGILYFEFYSINEEKKAINNRTSIIEPFCDIDNGTIDPDSANYVETKEFGILNDDFTINKKTIIKYNK